MTRILSYNILYGGTSRVSELTKMIGSVQPDVVGLVEASGDAMPVAALLPLAPSNAAL